MPWYRRAMKDVKSCDKLRGAAIGFDPEMSEWGNPVRVMSHHPKGSERGELKHLSTLREKSNEIPLVAASEDGRA